MGFLHKQQIIKACILKSGKMTLNDSCSVSVFDQYVRVVHLNAFTSWDGCLIIWAVCKVAKEAIIQMRRLLFKSILV